jgi:hypothetical protein
MGQTQDFKKKDLGLALTISTCLISLMGVSYRRSSLQFNIRGFDQAGSRSLNPQRKDNPGLKALYVLDATTHFVATAGGLTFMEKNLQTSIPPRLWQRSQKGTGMTSNDLSNCERPKDRKRSYESFNDVTKCPRTFVQLPIPSRLIHVP